GSDFGCNTCNSRRSAALATCNRVQNAGSHHSRATGVVEVSEVDAGSTRDCDSAVYPAAVHRAWRCLFARSRSDAAEVGLLASSRDRKSTRLNSSHSQISYAVFCLKK